MKRAMTCGGCLALMMAWGANTQPIGVFDSGVGGLTVLEKLLTLDRVDNETGAVVPDGVPDLAGEAFTFLGDQANMPYGDYAAAGKSAFLRELIIRDAFFLLSNGYWQNTQEAWPGGRKEPAKIIVIACNTATAYGLSGINASLRNVGSPTRVIGVVNAGARGVIDHLVKIGRADDISVGVLSTPGTHASGVYRRTIKAEAARRGLSKNLWVYSQGCPGLADAIELGQTNAADKAKAALHDLMLQVLKPNHPRPLAAVVLGCTHFPFVQKALDEKLRELREAPFYAHLVAPNFTFIDPALETAAECRAALAEDRLLAGGTGNKCQFFLSVPAATNVEAAADGTLPRDYKYGRKTGTDVIDTRIVPIGKGTVDPVVLKRLVNMLPAVKRELVR